MSGREHERVPCTVRVEFRTASAFLVAYSVNLSRGGIFLETDHPAAIGTKIALELTIPQGGSIALEGMVSWRRDSAEPGLPRGIGVAFTNVDDELGTLIDHLVQDFSGIHVVLLCADRQDRSALTRMIRSIIGTAQVQLAADEHEFASLLGGQVDAVVIDADPDPEAAFRALAAARAADVRLPTIVLASARQVRSRALHEGATEVTDSPPPLPVLQRLLVRVIGRPASVIERPLSL
jgi:uncharacterized protein (TIGR02266 family)